MFPYLAMLKNLPWKAIGIVACVLFLLYAGWYARGVVEENKQVKLQNERLESTLAENKRLAKELDDANTKFNQEMNDAKNTIDTLRDDIRDGSVRLSIPVSTCTGSAPGASANSGEARTELDRKTSEDLIRITSDGDDAIRQLNACINILEKERADAR